MEERIHKLWWLFIVVLTMAFGCVGDVPVVEKIVVSFGDNNTNHKLMLKFSRLGIDILVAV